MNRSATSREELLSLSMELAEEKGFQALGIRDLAARAGVSVGCIYNYFPSKAALMAAAVERVWQEIFRAGESEGPPGGFPETLGWMYERIREGSDRFPDFFAAHAEGFSARASGEGRQAMGRYIAGIKERLLRELERDGRLRADAFEGELSREQLVDFAFDSLLAALGRKAPDCGALLALIRQAIF